MNQEKTLNTGLIHCDTWATEVVILELWPLLAQFCDHQVTHVEINNWSLTLHLMRKTTASWGLGSGEASDMRLHELKVTCELIKNQGIVISHDGLGWDFCELFLPSVYELHDMRQTSKTSTELWFILHYTDKNWSPLCPIIWSTKCREASVHVYHAISQEKVTDSQFWIFANETAERRSKAGEAAP